MHHSMENLHPSLQMRLDPPLNYKPTSFQLGRFNMAFAVSGWVFWTAKSKHVSLFSTQMFALLSRRISSTSVWPLYAANMAAVWPTQFPMLTIAGSCWINNCTVFAQPSRLAKWRAVSFSSSLYREKVWSQWMCLLLLWPSFHSCNIKLSGVSTL